ncbi:MAG: nucleotidyltransferase family protein [Propionibacteriaceae bacterium]
MTSELRPLAKLLVDSVRLTGREQLGPELTELPFRAVLEAAALHRVTPAVAHLVSRCADAPPEWTGPLQGARHSQLMRLLRARAELQEMGAALDDAGIGWVAIKGPVAADTGWPRPDLREFYDLDLLVDPARFSDALVALRSAGATEVDRNWPLLEQTMRAEIGMLGPFGTPLDVHWDIAVPLRLRRAFRIDVPAMLARRRRVTLGDGRPTWVLDPADSVVHLAFHAAQAGMGRLLWSADVAFACRRLETQDWADLADRARAARIELPVALVLRRAAAIFPDLRVDPAALAPARRLWGRLVTARDVAVPFPGLPGDKHLGGTLYAAARRRFGASVATAVSNRIELFGIERRAHLVHETETQALERDVMNHQARSRYLERVLAHGRR